MRIGFLYTYLRENEGFHSYSPTIREERSCVLLLRANEAPPEYQTHQVIKLQVLVDLLMVV
jgi:hypothetical protein